MITALRVGLNMERSPLPVSFADPTHLSSLTADIDGVQSRARILAFRDLQVQRGPPMMPSDDDPVLFKVFIGRHDMPLNEILYQCTEDGIFSTFGQPQSPAIPLPTLRTVRNPKRSNIYADVEDLDVFVAGDHMKLWTSQGLLTHLNVEVPPDITQSTSLKSPVTDWQDIYSVMTGKQNSSRGNTTSIQLAKALEKVRVGVRKGVERPKKLQTLREVIGRPVLTSHFEAGSQELKDTVEALSTKDDLQVRVAPLPQGLAETSSLIGLFQRLSEMWVTTLPLSTDNSIRLRKDRLARSVATDLALASVTIGPVVEAVLPSAGAESQNGREGTMDDGLDGLPSSPPSQTSTAPSGISTEDPACARLRRYGVVTKPIVPLSTSTTLLDMLAHLPTDINVDPSTYSWRETEARLATARTEEDAEILNPRQEAARRRKAKKLAASQKKRLEAQRQISQAAELNFAPPTILTSTRDVQSSQQRPADEEIGTPIVMTQPVRGNFGTRIGPTGKKQGAKKSRVQGF